MGRFEPIGFPPRWDICQKGKINAIGRNDRYVRWVHPSGAGGTA